MTAWRVHKFGGSSVADAACMERVARILEDDPRRRVAAVLSACRGVTDALLELVTAAERQEDGDVFDRELRQGQIQRVDVTRDCSILAVVGDGMAGTPGIAAKLFNALGASGVNVRAIAQGASERNISVVIDATRRRAHSGRSTRASTCRRTRFQSASSDRGWSAVPFSISSPPRRNG